MTNYQYYKNEYEQAKLELELIKNGAEVSLCKLVQSDDFDVEQIVSIGEAIKSGKSRVGYHKEKLDEYLRENPEEVEGNNE